MNTTKIDHTNVNVLVVEDSTTQAMLLKETLEAHHLIVNLAQDGKEALEQMKKNAPNIVISDIEMPNLNGYDLCRHIKTDPAFKGIPVILLTNLTDAMDVIKGIECGADSFITKPFEINFLLSTIQDVLQNKKLHNELPPGKQLEFFFGGQRHMLQVNQVQITDLLLSTYSNAIQKNSELEQAYRKLNRLYEEIERKNKELNNLNQQKNQLLGMAAHDLRNPLSIILGYSDLLQSHLKGKIESELLRMLDRIKNSSSFMLQLINDLLDISIIESGTVNLHLSQANLSELIEENIVFLREIAEKKNIKLSFLSNKLLPPILCDANKISQIIHNLVGNAIKFSKPGDTVQISLEPSEKYIIMAVKDHGMGIPPESKERLFQPFSKVSAIGTAGEKGTGLGLAIAHKIVAEHKGKIWVESQVNKETTFFVSLPLKP